MDRYTDGAVGDDGAGDGEMWDRVARDLRAESERLRSHDADAIRLAAALSALADRAQQAASSAVERRLVSDDRQAESRKRLERG